MPPRPRPRSGPPAAEVAPRYPGRPPDATRGGVPPIDRCPRQGSNLALDLRTVACVPTHPEDIGNVPRPGIGPGPAASNTAVRPTHSRGIPSPGIEPGLRPSEGRVRNPSHSEGRETGRDSGQQGREDLNPVREFWRLAALPGARPSVCPTGFEPAPTASQAGMLPFTPRAQRKGRDSNPQGCSLARVPGGSRHRDRVALPSRLFFATPTDQRKARDSNPHAPGGSPLSRRARPTVSGCLPGRNRVDRRGVEPRFPVCKTGVFPFDEQPKPCETSPARGAVIPEGIEPPSPGCKPGALPLDHGTRSKAVARVGFEPRGTGLSARPLRRFADRAIGPGRTPGVPGPGIEPGGRPYESRPGACHAWGRRIEDRR